MKMQNVVPPSSPRIACRFRCKHNSSQLLKKKPDSASITTCCASAKACTKSHIYRILRSGEVRVNKGRIDQLYRLEAG
jgi:23S rRNA pseudouridine955/2504/2580 synthase